LTLAIADFRVALAFTCNSSESIFGNTVGRGDSLGVAFPARKATEQLFDGLHDTENASLPRLAK